MSRHDSDSPSGFSQPYSPHPSATPTHPSPARSNLLPQQAADPSAVANSNGNSSNEDSQGKDQKDSSVPAACLGCRSKHLKCDGQTPCSRCVMSSCECVYVASRRGYKGPRRGTTQNPNKRHATSPPDSDSRGANCPMLLGSGVSSTPSVQGPGSVNAYGQSPYPSGTSPASQFHSSPSQTPGANGGPSNMQLYRSYCSINGIDTGIPGTNRYQDSSAVQLPAPTLSQRCMDAFYYYFHSSHPFVLPRDYLVQVAKEGATKPLIAAIEWVGSIFTDIEPASRANLFEEAYRLIYEPQRLPDGFLVQAMMLLIVGLDGNCQQERARDILAKAEMAALQIALNSRAFATRNGRGLPVLEESWRRTWWDLFVIDGMIAGVHRVTDFPLFDMAADVALPCEESQYMSANIPEPMYLDELEDREFSGDEREYSSFAYRILCARNLGKFMRTPPILGPDDENLAKIETLLTNWRLHLPAAKRDALHRDGKLDEMMFQAQMMMHATSILLHQPHSQLDSSSAQNINSCATHVVTPGGDLFNRHTKHTISSASEISQLITHRVPLLSHTHFFTCVITLSSIVHLSKWALCFIPYDDDDLRQQVRLNIGALNKLSEVWNAANMARGQVKGVAQEIYKAKKQQQQNPAYWLGLGLSQEDMIQSMATDASIISDIENLQSMPSMLG